MSGIAIDVSDFFFGGEYDESVPDLPDIPDELAPERVKRHPLSFDPVQEPVKWHSFDLVQEPVKRHSFDPVQEPVKRHPLSFDMAHKPVNRHSFDPVFEPKPKPAFGPMSTKPAFQPKADFVPFNPAPFYEASTSFPSDPYDGGYAPMELC